jgi:hypothetical protein
VSRCGASATIFRLVESDGDGHPDNESDEQLPDRDGVMVESKPALFS